MNNTLQLILAFLLIITGFFLLYLVDWRIGWGILMLTFASRWLDSIR